MNSKTYRARCGCRVEMQMAGYAIEGPWGSASATHVTLTVTCAESCREHRANSPAGDSARDALRAQARKTLELSPPMGRTK